ncbi:MAG: ABC transporter ATP-binding protein, partial [Calditrichaeota bacterium]
MYVIETFELTKKFSRGKIIALNQVSLTVEKGQIFGLLGPNGAGKTTLIKILLGILYPTAGTAKVLGQPLKDYRIKEKIGYLPENHHFPEFLKGGEVLDYWGRMTGLGRTQLEQNKRRLLKLVRMEEWQNTKLKKYSKGMLQRLGLAQAMLNDPEILFLDEPTDGVDPIGRKEIRDILLQLKDEGKTIFLNSHLLSEVEMICDEVAILDKGQLVKRGSVQELTSPSKTYRIETSPLEDEIIDGLKKFSTQLECHNGYFELSIGNQKTLNGVIDFLRSHSVEINA